MYTFFLLLFSRETVHKRFCFHFHRGNPHKLLFLLQRVMSINVFGACFYSDISHIIYQYEKHNTKYSNSTSSWLVQRHASCISPELLLCFFHIEHCAKTRFALTKFIWLCKNWKWTLAVKTRTGCSHKVHNIDNCFLTPSQLWRSYQSNHKVHNNITFVRPTETDTCLNAWKKMIRTVICVSFCFFFFSNVVDIFYAMWLCKVQ